MKKRCIWCNRHSDNIKEVTVTLPKRRGFDFETKTFPVMPECEKEFQSFADFMKEKTSFLMTGILISTAAIILASAGLIAELVSDRTAAWVIGAAVAVQGVLIVKYPFVTPETRNAFGVRSSVKVARVTGAIAALTGIIIPILYYFKTA